MPLVSVVIPAFNEEKYIAQCLQSLADQKTDQNFEVILVDNGSCDRTVQIAAKFKSKLNLTIVSERKKGRSPARKKGFELAQGEVIFSTDADTSVPEDWIDLIMPNFQDKKVAAVTGIGFINDSHLIISRLFHFFQLLIINAYKLIYGHYWLNGCNFAIRKSVYDKSDGFDPKMNALEDIDLTFKIVKYGKIKFLSSVLVYWSGRRFKQQGFIKGTWSYLCSFRHYRRGRTEKTYLSDV